MPEVLIDWSRYHRPDEQAQYLRQMNEQFPQLTGLESIGKSHQGRDIWALTVTNRATGAPETKAAIYIDGNNHGEEVSGAEAVLYMAWDLLERYGDDPQVSDLVDRYTFYLLPCINPDGADISLTTPYNHVGNGHFFQGDFLPAKGLYARDIDGNGKALSMRVNDPAGEWKVSALDPRLMELRQPGEYGGEYFRLYPEGLIAAHQTGTDVFNPKPPHGNLNRQFPANWGPERDEYGAGSLPLNEPEAAAVATFIVDHPNIGFVIPFHTHGGIILRLSSYRPDAELHPADVQLFRLMGQRAQDLTGYKSVSIFEDFTRDKRNARHGGFGDWVYESLGVLFLCPELWDMELEAGLRPPDFAPLRAADPEVQKTLLEWQDREFDGRYFTPWTPYEHPQLGQVEIGGWDPMYMVRNPPPERLEKTCRSQLAFLREMAGALPDIRVERVTTEHLGADLFRVSALVKNQGYLPTYLTQLGRETRTIPPVSALLELDGCALVMNEQVQEVGHLEGRSQRRSPLNHWGPAWQPTTVRREWLVRLERKDAAVTVVASSVKGGVDRKTVNLGQ